MRQVFSVRTIALAICPTATIAAGPLNPPPGVVESTGRFGPRIEISQATTPGDADSVFRITQPGSYYLAGNVIGQTGRSGIEIAASGVTIDLMGFSLIGGAEGVQSGITTDGAQSRITIRNGLVSNGFSSGVNLAAAGGGDASLVESLRVAFNAGVGIRVGIRSIIRGCSSLSNGTNILAGDGCLIESSLAEGGGFVGIDAGEGSVIRDCVARLNAGDGIRAGGGSTIVACAARENGGDGIFAGPASAISSCTVRDNLDHGIATNTDATIVACAAFGNGGNGIIVGGGSTIVSCSARGNMDNGIIAAASTITTCTASVNAGDGIEVTDSCLVLNNACDLNGLIGDGDGAGILATGTDNRIDANNATGNTRDFELAAGGNLMVRNSASGNGSNYVIAGGNTYGQILVLPGANFVSSNPWANIQY